MPARGWNSRRALAACVAGACLFTGLASVTAQSFAAVGAGPDAADSGDLVVEARPLPTWFFDMSAGERRYWSIDASLEDADRGSLALRVFGDGALVEHPQHPLTIEIEGCDGRLVGDDPRVHPTCEGADYTQIVAEQPLVDISSDPSQDQADEVWSLPDIIRGQARSFVVTLAVPASGADDKTLMGLRGEIGVGLFAAGQDAGGSDADGTDADGDEPSSPSETSAPESSGAATPTGLATTGAALPVSLLMIAAGVIGLGAVLGRVQAARRASSGRSPS